MSRRKNAARRIGDPAPLSLEELEAGLRALGENEVDEYRFWTENGPAFKQTVLFAIRETSDSLLSPKIPLHWRMQLQSELAELVHYLHIADLRMAKPSRASSH